MSPLFNRHPLKGLPPLLNGLEPRSLRGLAAWLTCLIVMVFCAACHPGYAQPTPRVFAVAQQGGKLNGGTLINLNFNSVGVAVNFGTPYVRPRHRNLVGPDGYLYNFGRGGNYGMGGIFKVKPDGSDYRQLHDFSDLYLSVSNTDGVTDGSMVITPDGVIYGATVQGGMYQSGVLYRINGDGTRYKRLLDFPYASVAGNESGALVLGADGFLYGIHQVGTTNQGNIYKVATDGSGLTEIFRFYDQQLANAKHLHWGSDGRLYGIARINGSGRYVLFRIDTDGSNYLALHTFDESADAGVHESSDGLLYGTVGGGGAFGRGYIYRCARDGSAYEVTHDFNTDTFGSILGLREHPNGFLYGVTVSGGTYGQGAVYRIRHDGSSFEIIHHLPLNSEKSELAFAQNSILLFSTSAGDDDKGTLYRIFTDGSGAVVRSFVEDPSLAVYPFASLAQTQDTRMNFLAMRRDLSGRAPLFSFRTADGSLDTRTEKLEGLNSGGFSKMVDGNDGFWYWISSYNGIGGTVVRGKVDGSPAETVYEFNLATGSGPLPDIMVHKGYVYGTCPQGGVTTKGVIFRVKTDGTGYQVLHDNQQLQIMPSLVIGPDERLYFWDGILYSRKLDGTDARQLHNFGTDRFVSAPLTVVGDQVYGVLGQGFTGPAYAGGIFNVSTSGTGYRELHTFTDTDGARPFTSLLPYYGELFGATFAGGQNQMGTLFRVDLVSGQLTTIRHLDQETGYGVTMRLLGICLTVETPTIALSGNLLTSSSTLGNQWYRNGDAIVGAVHPTLEVTESGTYQVMTLIGDCASELSAEVVMSIDGVEEDGGIAVYPNPTTGKLVVETGVGEGETVRMVVRDVLGVEEQVYEGAGGKVVFDLGGRAPGLYMVGVIVRGKEVQRKVVVR